MWLILAIPSIDYHIAQDPNCTIRWTIPYRYVSTLLAAEAFGGLAELDLGLMGKVALVTGSSRGIGRACAEALIAEGAKVTICARNVEGLERVQKEMLRENGAEVLAIPADITKYMDIKNLVDSTIQRFQNIDILVTNAGGPPAGQFMELSEEQWTGAVPLILLSVVRLCHEVVPHMQKRRWGRIINLTSFSTRHVIDNLALSNSLRLAVIGLSKTLALELGKFNITVNSVCQGYTATERLKGLAADAARREGIDVKEVESRWAGGIALGRFAEPDEIASVVTFLASERASYLTGAAILVDGGLSRVPL